MERATWPRSWPRTLETRNRRGFPSEHGAIVALHGTIARGGEREESLPRLLVERHALAARAELLELVLEVRLDVLRPLELLRRFLDVELSVERTGKDRAVVRCG